MTGLSAQALAFARKKGCPNDGWVQLPADASPRRYFRQPCSPFGPCLLMVTDPDAPDLRAYLQIAAHLDGLGLSAPQIYAADISSGLALIEDFGDNTYTSLLRAGVDEHGLYETGIDALIQLHNHPKGGQIDLPAFDMPALMQEVQLFPDWFAPSVAPGRDLTGFAQAFGALWRDALSDVAQRRDTLVLRDYHVDNLMLLTDRTDVARCGLLDFQDGLIGSAAYDVLSLTQDARRDVPQALEQVVLARYFAARPKLDTKQFMQDFHLLAAQRHTKVAGIFHRLSQRDGKPHYLTHMPRVLRLLDQALHHAGLREIRALMDTHISGWNGAAAAPTSFRQDAKNV